MIFLPHTNTVILLEPYCGTITEPGLPVLMPGYRISRFFFLLFFWQGEGGRGLKPTKNLPFV